MEQMNFLADDIKAKAFDNIVEHLDAHKRAAIWYNINEEYDIDSLSDFEYKQIYINKLEDLIMTIVRIMRKPPICNFI